MMGVLWNRFHSRSLWPLVNRFYKITHVAWGFHRLLDKIRFDSAILAFRLCRWNRFDRTKFEMPLQQLPKKLAPVPIWPIISTTTIGKTMTPAASWSVPQLRRASRSRDCLWRWCHTVKAAEIICLMILLWHVIHVKAKPQKSPNGNKENRKCLVAGSWNPKSKERHTLRENFWKRPLQLDSPHDDTWMFAYASTKQILKSRYLFRTASPSVQANYSLTALGLKNHLTSLDTILTSQPTNPFCFNSPTP